MPMETLIARLVLWAMIAGAAIAGYLAFSTAHAQPVPCGPAESLLRHLQERFGEEPHMIMKAGPATFILTLSDDGNWTLLRMDGIQACVVVSGTDAKREAGI